MSETIVEADQTEPAPAPRPRRRRWRRVLAWALTTVLVLVTAASLTAGWEVRRSFPEYGGTLHLRGLSAPVEVYRDSYAIPQVYASTADDLFRAQGYVHAQERFWEMDFRRHVTAGRLAELFGPDQVSTDTYLRTLGWRRVAEREWDLLAPQTREYLSAYADGVNEWLRQHGDGEASGAVSLEYTILGLQNSGYRIEKWTPVDSLSWLKAMAWDLRGNMTDEIERATLLAAGLSKDQIAALYPAYPFDRNAPIVSGGTVAGGAFVPAGASAPPADLMRRAAPALEAVRAGVANLPALLGPNGTGIGSNSWVVGGSRTATGKPLLANDPHLGPSMPGIWYQMGLHCTCGLNVQGYTFSGVPGVVIGHNDRIAWGFTNLGPDVTDLYLEKLDGDRYQVGDSWRDLDRRTETITVAGGTPVTVTVRTSKDGPLLSDASDDLRKLGGGYGLALKWTALSPGRTMDAVFTLDAAGGWADFRHAAEQFEVPAQNMIYADVDGNIGYQAPGRIPIRTKGDGKWPAPGWDPAYEWQGYVPFAELPSVLNPAQGYVVTANQAVAGQSYPVFLTDDWEYGYRSQRINDMIGSAAAKLTVDDVRQMQFDNRNGMAPTLVPALLRASLTGLTGLTGLTARAQALLRDWDFQQPADGASGSTDARRSAAAAYYNAVWSHLLARAFDELPAGHKPDGGDRWFEVVRRLLAEPDSPWWDDRSTSAHETEDDIVAAAMRDAATELGKRLGDDPAAWRWGTLHQITVRNQTFGKSGIGPIEWMFNVGPVDTSGGQAIVNATGWDARNGYQVDWVPSMRMIVDLSNLDGSRWVQLTGESGHAFSAHYHDQLELWRTGRDLPMRWNRDAIVHESVDHLTLRP